MKKIEQLKFYGKMLLLNRRSSIVMFIGLGISLALIAESLMFMYSFQYGAFNGFYQETPTKQFTIGLSAYDISEEKEQIVNFLEDLTLESVDEVKLTEKVIKVDWFLGRGLFLAVDNLVGNVTFVPEFNLYGIPADYLSALQVLLYNGTLPQRTGEVICVADAEIISSTNISLLSSIAVYSQIFAFPPLSFEEVVEIGMPDVGTFVNVSGVIKSVDFKNPQGSFANNIKALVDYLGENVLLTSYTSFYKIVNDIQYLHNYATPIGRIAFDLDSINSFRIKEEISSINSLAQEITRSFEKNNFDEVHVYAFINDMLLDFNQEFIVFQLFGILFITPIIGMSLSLTNYSANLMKRRQKRQVSNMLQRGASRKEVLTLLVGQIIELTITAILISIILGYSFCLLMSQSMGFLNFTGAIRAPALNIVVFYTIIVGGFVLAIIINATNIWKMSQITTYEAYSEHQQSKPLWEKMFLDIFLLVIGISLWLVVRLKLQGVSAYQFVYGLGTTAPICIILGGILFASRTYPKIVDYISNLSWRAKNFEIIGLAMKRSSRRKADTVRSLILISLTFTLIFSSLITINSYQEHDNEKAYYSLGADILVKTVNAFNDDMKDRVLAIEGVQSATYVRSTTQVVAFGSATYSYIVLGIDPNEFAKTAYFDNEYLDMKNPEDFFSRLINSDQVFLQKDELAKIGGTVGTNLTIVYYKYPYGYLNRTIQVLDTYNFLPRFYLEKPREGTTSYRFAILGTYSNVAQFASSSYNINGDLLVKVTSGYDISQVKVSIEDELQRGIDCVIDKKETFEGSLRNIMLYGSVNASFISSLIITTTAIILMILIQSLENEREVVTLKILGISPKQLFSMFLTEASSVVAFGSIIGAGLGIFAAVMFTDMLTFETQIPVTEIMVPGLELTLAYLLLFGSSIIAAALTSWLIFRKDTIKAIKQI